MMLLAAAAARWQAAPGEVVLAGGVATHAPSGRSASSGQLAQAAAAQTVPSEVKLKPDGSYQLERVVCAVDCGIAVNLTSAAPRLDHQPARATWPISTWPRQLPLPRPWPCFSTSSAKRTAGSSASLRI